MPIADTYPVFEPDQVLTNDHLNSVMNYLDQQDRLTRMKLIGSGIVCGLEIESGNNDIKVSKGCALTSQGFMICVPSRTYTHYVPYTAPLLPEHLDFIRQEDDSNTITDIPFYGEKFTGLFRLLTSADLDGLTEEVTSLEESDAGFLDKYVVVLFLEAAELNLKNCDTNDCNDKGSQMHFDVKALLVEKTMLDEIIKRNGGGVNASRDIIPVLKRYNVPAVQLNTAADVLLAFRDIADKPTLSSIAEALKACAKKYHFILPNENQNIFDNVETYLTGLRDEILKQFPILIQYFYDYLDDIIKAYTEFVRKAHLVNSECCMNEMRFPLHIMLGEAASNTTAVSAYREYFIYSPLFDAQRGGPAELRSLFTRLRLLISEFTIENMLGFEKKEVKITPGNYGRAPLSDRCIPYYYKVDEPGNELYRSWSYEKTRAGEEDLNQGYNSSDYNAPIQITNPLLFDIEAFNFLRIEGHIGKNIVDAISLVKNEQQQNNLPFEVVALSADYIGTLVKGEEPQCIIQDLESDYRIIIATFICQLHDVFCKVARTEFNPVNVLPLASLSTASSSATRIVGNMLTTITKEEEEEETKILTTAMSINFEALNHGSLPQLVSEFHLSKQYRKGDTLSRLCKPAKNTVGSAYISMINNGGQFRNPIVISTSVLGSFLRNGFFELIDSVESMFQILMNNELADLDLNSFKAAYSRFEVSVNSLADRLARLKISTPAFLNTCIYEKLEALKSEYLRRTAQYRLAKNFSYYFSRHGGVEHKAGVPKGGTFILVYHEERRRQVFDIGSILVNKDLSTMLLRQFPDILRIGEEDDLEAKTKELQTATEFKEPELFLRFKDVFTKYLDECKDMPKPKRDALTAIVNLPPQKPVFRLADGMVIADFFVPYLCCSDCPPIAYILPPLPKPDTEDASIKIDKNKFCNNDTNEFPLLVSPAGGTVTATAGVSKNSAGNFVFSPAGLNAGVYALTYQVNNKTAAVTVEVTAIPRPKFGFTSSIESEKMTVSFINQSTDVSDQTVYEWLDDGIKFSDKKDPDPISFKVQSLPHTILLRATNDGCPIQSNELKLELLRKSIMVCRDVKNLTLETPAADAVVKVIFNEGNIVDDKLVIHPSATNVKKTTAFNVIYSVNGVHSFVTITVVVADADFTMELKQSNIGTNVQPVTLTLQSKGEGLTLSQWTIKQGNTVITDITDGKPISLSSDQFTPGAAIDITHHVEIKTDAETCKGDANFKLTRTIVATQLNKGLFDNNFTG